MRYWFDSELGDIFGVAERPSPANADVLYDQIRPVASASFRPRALLARFGIEVLATTDDPRTIWRPMTHSPRTDFRRPGDPDLPPGPVPGAGAHRLGRRR